jgi:cytochrome oxidase Cu insertion factor (SCO1/SenC/PrrC family)
LFRVLYFFLLLLIRALFAIFVVFVFTSLLVARHQKHLDRFPHVRDSVKCAQVVQRFVSASVFLVDE